MTASAPSIRSLSAPEAAAPATPVQDNSVGWQVHQLTQRLSEWIEWRLSQLPEDTSATPDPFRLPGWLEALLFGLLVLGLALLLGLLMVQILNAYLARRSPARSRSVPGQPVYKPSEWVHQANQLAQAEQWSAACRALYMAALQRLHERQPIPYPESRTDQDYLRYLSELPQPRPYQLLIRTHERSHFGREPLREQHYQRCRQAYQEIEKS
ncbi:MAG: DUF4129 domain-containing protein [Leptolyngbya sp. SIO4C1]|nr:DUF4129 domain-containing protein [Leptolyngbya sp. SIO4C1]